MREFYQTDIDCPNRMWNAPTPERLRPREQGRVEGAMDFVHLGVPRDPKTRLRAKGSTIWETRLVPCITYKLS